MTATTDPGPITRSLIRTADGMAWKYARQLPPHVEYEEMQGVARLALAEAARTWVPRPGIPFGAYAVVVVRGRMIDHVRRLMRTTSLDTHTTEYMEQTFQAPDPDPADIAADRDEYEEALELLQLLPEKYIRPIQMVYIDGVHKYDAARELGLARSTVSKRCSTGLAMLRRLLELRHLQETG